MSKKLIPLGNRIIGKRIKDNGEFKKTASGIILASNTPESEKYSRIEVLRVGPGYHSQMGAFIPMEIKPGDIVFLVKIAPFIMPKDMDETPIAENEELVLFQDSDIIMAQIDE